MAGKDFALAELFLFDGAAEALADVGAAETAVYRKGDANTEAFVNWLIGEEGQKAVRQAGYVTLH